MSNGVINAVEILNEKQEVGKLAGIGKSEDGIGKSKVKSEVIVANGKLVIGKNLCGDEMIPESLRPSWSARQAKLLEEKDIKRDIKSSRPVSATTLRPVSERPVSQMRATSGHQTGNVVRPMSASSAVRPGLTIRPLSASATRPCITGTTSAIRASRLESATRPFSGVQSVRTESRKESESRGDILDGDILDGSCETEELGGDITQEIEGDIARPTTYTSTDTRGYFTSTTPSHKSNFELRFNYKSEWNYALKESNNSDGLKNNNDNDFARSPSFSDSPLRVEAMPNVRAPSREEPTLNQLGWDHAGIGFNNISPDFNGRNPMPEAGHGLGRGERIREEEVEGNLDYRASRSSSRGGGRNDLHTTSTGSSLEGSSNNSCNQYHHPSTFPDHHASGSGDNRSFNPVVVPINYNNASRKVQGGGRQMQGGERPIYRIAGGHNVNDSPNDEENSSESHSEHNNGRNNSDSFPRSFMDFHGGSDGGGTNYNTTVRSLTSSASSTTSMSGGTSTDDSLLQNRNRFRALGNEMDPFGLHEMYEEEREHEQLYMQELREGLGAVGPVGEPVEEFANIIDSFGAEVFGTPIWGVMTRAAFFRRQHSEIQKERSKRRIISASQHRERKVDKSASLSRNTLYGLGHHPGHDKNVEKTILQKIDAHYKSVELGSSTDDGKDRKFQNHTGNFFSNAKNLITRAKNNSLLDQVYQVYPPTLLESTEKAYYRLGDSRRGSTSVHETSRPQSKIDHSWREALKSSNQSDGRSFRSGRTTGRRSGSGRTSRSNSRMNSRSNSGVGIEVRRESSDRREDASFSESVSENLFVHDVASVKENSAYASNNGDGKEIESVDKEKDRHTDKNNDKHIDNTKPEAREESALDDDEKGDSVDTASLEVVGRAVRFEVEEPVFEGQWQ